MHGSVYVFLLYVGFWCCQCVGWMSGLDCLGLTCQSCGLNMLVGFPLASLVVVGLGGVHAWFCACFPFMLALCVVTVLVGYLALGLGLCLKLRFKHVG